MVRLGEWRISTVKDCEKDLVNQECSDPVVDLNIEKTIPYEQYNRRNGRNDIALLRLERDIEFTGKTAQPLLILVKSFFC